MNETIAQPDGRRPLLKAAWTRFAFLHYSLPAGDLAPFTPLELDCRDGRAFVSLVVFRFERMGPARFLPGRVGRALFRPASDHWFLNVRTYVRGGAGPGIQFLIEWMDNPIGLRLGPLLYGLPYRRGRFDCPVEKHNDESRLRVTDPETGEALHVSILNDARGAAAVSPTSLDGFLLERYTAYTHHRGIFRYFHIAHPHWEVTRPTLLGIDDTLIRSACPYFKHAEMLLAHASVGFQDVAMGLPHRLRETAPADHLSSVTALEKAFL